MTNQKASPDSAAERLLSCVLYPFVVVFDAGRKVMDSVFGLAERLDPIAAMEKLLGRLVPSLVRLIAPVLAKLMGIWRLIRLVEQLFLRLVAFLFSWILPALNRIFTSLIAAGKLLWRPVQVARTRARELAGPLIERVAKSWALARLPFRRVLTRIRAQRRRLVERFTRR